ncbi:hypothetical protein phytr_6700 [Candidatus Phycorickettsia trachydisci]|uniref:Uncharacterized protein n=1 Tax=Candidatus Phycorickettsia trachydisci TaxID=2115978 RepID=A0A2P1P8M4_9RICK|nr:ankyrin repeat domain-containing protein [Candidatus Phycorickettsia trachydisci]AVP87611.1 hypothetical protein phytr_6700 [Candidatus Phycorickettsia trachydisci]
MQKSIISLKELKKNNTKLLLQAMDKGDDALVEKIFKDRDFKKDFDFSIKNEEGISFLHVAVNYKKLDIIQYLCQERGMDINDSLINGFTPIHHAARKGWIDLIEDIKSYGGDMNLVDDEDKTALAEAAENGHIDAINKLIDFGANVNGKNPFRTPMMYSIFSGKLEVAKALKARGAKTDLKYKGGDSWLHLAASIGDYSKISQTLEWLLTQEPRMINDINENGETALHVAAGKGKLDLVQFLESHGANLVSQDNHKSLPIERAAMSGHIEVVKYLASTAARIDDSFMRITSLFPFDQLDSLLKMCNVIWVFGQFKGSNYENYVNSSANLVTTFLSKHSLDDFEYSEVYNSVQISDSIENLHSVACKITNPGPEYKMQNSMAFKNMQRLMREKGLPEIKKALLETKSLCSAEVESLIENAFTKYTESELKTNLLQFFTSIKIEEDGEASEEKKTEAETIENISNTNSATTAGDTETANELEGAS